MMAADTLFIFSAGRSGSTLLDLMVGAHPKVASLGEITYLPRSFKRNAMCSCGLPVRECSFWDTLAEKIRQRMGPDLRKAPYDLDLGFMYATHHVDRDKQTPPYVLGWKLLHALFMLRTRLGIALLDPLLSKLYRTIDNNFSLFDLVREEANAAVVVDSSKAYVKGLAMYRRRPERVRAILLSRDGRGVLYSRMREGILREAGLKVWQTYYSRALPLIEKSIRPEHLLRVKYEELVSDPAGSANRIFEFLGLPKLEGDIAFASRVQHMPEGNDTRLRGLSNIKLDEAWRREMSPADLDFFEREGGTVNRKLGYQ
jgi:hypothetical protein